MHLIKRQTTNLRNIAGKGISYDINGQVILDSSNVMLIPKGTTAERPETPELGHMRFNTTSGEFELYQNSEWRKMRFKEPRDIVQQSIGTGDAIETIFGPLTNGDADYSAPASATAIMVFIENVYQLSTINYSLIQNPGGSFADGWYVEFESPVPDNKPVTVIHNFDK